MYKTILSLIIFTLILSSCDESKEETNVDAKKQQSLSPSEEDFADPEAPELVSPENNATVFEEKPLLEWSEVKGKGSYVVEIHQNEDMKAPSYSDYIEETQWRIEEKFMGLEDEGTYYWRVRKGSSEWSEVRSFTVDLSGN